MKPDPVLLWAQDHFLHGQLLTPWITDYIDLEESLAVGSIAQEEFAHAALLLELAGADLVGRDELIYRWPQARWAPAALATMPLPEWPDAVVRALLLATAAATRTASLGESPEPNRRDAAIVLLAEQQLHITHWSRWVFRLGNDPRTAAALAAAVTALLPAATDLFDGFGVDEPAEEQLRREWAKQVSTILRSGGVLADPLVHPATARLDGTHHDGLAAILAEVRELRTTPDDGVLGMYR
jgi:1,2-phenylacetyl-CoA epoxidase catalytic subunit